MEGFTSFCQVRCGIQVNNVQDSGSISRTHQDAFPQVKKHASERWPLAVESGIRRVWYPPLVEEFHLVQIVGFWPKG